MLKDFLYVLYLGRENEWLFSLENGQKELCEAAGFQRLVIATLHRGHEYNDIEMIKSELSSKVMDLAPSGMARGTKVTFLKFLSFDV